MSTAWGFGSQSIVIIVREAKNDDSQNRKVVKLHAVLNKTHLKSLMCQTYCILPVI